MKISTVCPFLATLLVLAVISCGDDRPRFNADIDKPAHRSPQPAPGMADADPRTQDMVFVPAGEFVMGSINENVSEDEKPAHSVFINSFYIDRHEVTNSQYQKFILATGHAAPFVDKPWAAPYNWNGTEYPEGKGDYPVVLVSWDDAQAYARWAGKRLPTEAEWEKAMRGNLVSKPYPLGDQLEMSHANFNKGFLRHNALQPVERFAPNGYGLYDMAGNVWEWCQDWYHESYYTISPSHNPAGPREGVYRVLRGGAWVNDKEFLRCSQRGKNIPDSKSHIIGFRCALSVEEQRLNQPQSTPRTLEKNFTVGTAHTPIERSR